MKIEHIAMYVNDLERAKDFFTKYFNRVRQAAVFWIRRIVVLLKIVEKEMCHIIFSIRADNENYQSQSGTGKFFLSSCARYDTIKKKMRLNKERETCRFKL